MANRDCRVLVTGANGFIGSHMVRTLLSAGRKVRGFVLRDADLRNLNGLDVEIIHGDLRDSASIKTAVKDCEAIYHLAAYNQLWSPTWDLPHTINVDGTEALLRAALEVQVQKFIYVGSATLFRAGNGAPAVEKDFLPEAPERNAYEHSKYVAERRVLDFVEQGLDAVCVAPTAPIGPGDLYLTGPGRLIIDFMKRKLPAYLDTGVNIIDVRVLTEAMLAAESKGEKGEQYILGGTNIRLKELLDELEGVTAIKGPSKRVPYWLAFSAAFVQEQIANYFTRRPPMAPLEGVRLARKPCYYNCQKARSQLGLGETNLRQTLKDAVQWFQENGFCS